MRRLAVLGATVLMLSGCSQLFGDDRNEEIPPKPIAGELCDAIGVERIEKLVPNARTTQTKDITGMGGLANLVDASCDAAGDAILRVVYTRYGQTARQTPAERGTQAVEKNCDQMRSGRWAEEQAKFNSGFRADPMDPPNQTVKGKCQISGRYDVREHPHAKISLVFGLKGNVVEVDLSTKLSTGRELNDSLVKLTGVELGMIATDLLSADL